MLGGISAWTSAGYPTVTGTQITEPYYYQKTTSFVYPNPVNCHSVIKINNIDLSNARIIFYDLTGKNICSFPCTSNTISLSGIIFEKGSYFYVVMSESKLLSCGKFEVIQ